MEQLEGIVIDLISDTHKRHRHFTPKGGDIIIHSGDASNTGEFNVLIDFLDWFGALPYKHKIFVPGNHDLAFEIMPAMWREECEKRGITLLINEGCEAMGIKIWGSPLSPTFGRWAFMADRGEQIRRYWDQIPMDTELLITHGPPHLFRDHCPGGNVGCRDLANKVVQTQVKLHVFGHVHEGRGHQRFYEKLFVNAAALDDYHRPARGLPIRIIKDITGCYFPNDVPGLVDDEDTDKDPV